MAFDQDFLVFHWFFAFFSSFCAAVSPSFSDSLVLRLVVFVAVSWLNVLEQCDSLSLAPSICNSIYVTRYMVEFCCAIILSILWFDYMRILCAIYRLTSNSSAVTAAASYASWWAYNQFVCWGYVVVTWTNETNDIYTARIEKFVLFSFSLSTFFHFIDICRVQTMDRLVVLIRTITRILSLTHTLAHCTRTISLRILPSNSPFRLVIVQHEQWRNRNDTEETAHKKIVVKDEIRYT